VSHVVKPRVKLSDVANLAGVSTTTASLVLSDRGDEMRISAESQAKVRDAATALGYRRNAVSVGLRTGSSNTIGFISDTVTTAQYAGEMIRGALDAASDGGYMLLIAETGGVPQEEARATDALIDRQIEGLILASMFTRMRKRPEVAAGVPIVLLNALPATQGWALAAVVPDEFSAGYAAATRLLESGHRRIHLVGAGPSYDEMPVAAVAARQRFDGIKAALAEAGLEPLTYSGAIDWEPEIGYALGKQLLEREIAGEAIIAFNDRIAFGLTQVFSDAGLSIPQDVSIISFDDEAIARQMRPALTTLALPHYELGRLAVEELLSAIRGGRVTRPNDKTEIRQVKMPLRERESIANSVTAVF
jgi:LacI family transcriptional regulator